MFPQNELPLEIWGLFRGGAVFQQGIFVRGPGHA